MSDNTFEELEDSYKMVKYALAHATTTRDKLLAKPSPSKASLKTLERNCNAFRIAMNLIVQEIGKFDGIEDESDYCLVCQAKIKE